MKCIIRIRGIAMVLFLGLTDAAAKPIPARNQMPLYLFYLQMLPEEASVTGRDKAVISADYTLSNITVSCFTPASSLYDIQIDMEINRYELGFKYGVYENLELGIEVPYMSFSSGYTDNLVEGFEDAVNARTPRSRERQGTDKFDYTFRYNGVYLINKKDSTEGLGDIVLNAKYQLLREGAWIPNFSLRSALKLPTGEKDDLLGSGEFDYGFGILADKSFFERFFIYGGFNAVFIESPGFFSVLGMDEQIYSFMLAAEYFFTPRFSLVTQCTGNTTPYPFSDTNVLDNEGYEAGLGVNYIWKEKKNVSWRFAVIENIGAASSPDVTFNTGLSVRF
ncbi:MAG: DUF3187 family protein [Candidatus Omnitrophota bacterium]